MPCFICEKCGKIDNTACANNYWHAKFNKLYRNKKEEIDISYKPEFSYFEDHVCCSDCCKDIEFSDGSGTISDLSSITIKDKPHWSEFGKEKLLELESRRDGSIENATEYLKSIGEL